VIDQDEFGDKSSKHGTSNMTYIDDAGNEVQRPHRAVANEYLPHPGLTKISEGGKTAADGSIEVSLI
jgi:hypothetical protein